MRIYIAARYSRRAEMAAQAGILRAAGHEVTSRWLVEHNVEWTGGHDPQWEEISLGDIEDIDSAEVVISFTHPRGTPVTGGGRHVEFGYAYAKGKKLIIVGPRENVFHHLPGVEFYQD